MPQSSDPGTKGGEALAGQTQFLNVVSRDEATAKLLGLQGESVAAPWPVL